MDEPVSAAYPLSSCSVSALVRSAVPAPGTDDVRQGVLAPTCVVAIGAFDGVHRGHQSLVAACVHEARECGASAVVVTFDPDPSELLRNDPRPYRLLSVADRVAICRRMGADEVLVLPFTRDLASRSPEEFVSLLLERLGSLASVHVGSNFRFGRRGAGTPESLRALGERQGFSVVTHALLQMGGATVSSTRIRGLLAEGRVADAAELLGRHHFVRGVVAHGRGEGTAFGFPTANVRCDARTSMPREGVYACLVTDGRLAWPAAANVGAPPSFDKRHDPCFLEANLIGFEGNLYGRELAVVFLEWLRASRPFSSLDELERVVLGNIDWVRQNVGSCAVEVGH